MTTENFVTRGLRSLGMQVRQLKVGATKTPDLLVSDGMCNYFIEVKDKFPDPSMMRRRAEVLDGGGVWEEEKALASISTRDSWVTRLACLEGDRDSGKLNDQLLVAEPGHRCGLIGQTGGDQVGIVCALVQGHHNRGCGDLHFSG